MKHIQTPMSRVLGRKYIEIYLEQRAKGYNGEMAHFKTQYRLQEAVIGLMVDMPKEISIIAKAYENIKHDTTLKEKAQITYDLSLCNEDIKAKYLPLVMV